MRVKRLQMTSFRGIGDLTLDFHESEPTVLIGINGVGKSSILDCLSLLLSRFMEWIGGYLPEEEIIKPIEMDISNHSTSTHLIISILWDNGELNWEIVRIRNGVSQDLGHEMTSSCANAIWRHWQKDPQYNIPLVVYYPVNRSALDITIEIPNKTDFNQIDAYDKALTGGQIDFASFFYWFRIIEDLENEKLRDKHDYINRQLEAVRQAIYSIIPEFSNLRVRRSPLRMTVRKQDEELIVNQLSDGEKCLLAMVGDLARRLAIANPGLPNPLEGSGVVMIDEIELHLHPKWQREIIPALKRTFPNCQFIITTHSPQIISQVKPDSIYILEKTNNGVIAIRPESSYGRDSNRILEDLMDTSERPQEIKERLQELFRLIDDGKLTEAREMKKYLVDEIGYSEPEFASADMLIRRKEILAR